MILRVGQAALRGDIARYARVFDLLELSSEPGRLPRAARLAEWRARVPESFVFSLRLPRAVAALDAAPGSDEALARALRAAESLQAGWLVLDTPASVTPAARHKRRLAELTEPLLERWRVAWAPRGVWLDDEAAAVSDELGVALVRDLGRSEPPDEAVVYTRLRGLGDGGSVRAGAVERAAELLADRDEAYVVVDGGGAVRAARMLRELVDDDRERAPDTGAEPEARP
ncbi:MAG: DUF72 domain-containing protein [Sorangiineae bacterium]|nr:DUF72 domain-containing protein [Polyangiaceae bacterium]MEB2323809.1 DUF72 domain-containing protein [Sorangiineae bacterium]